MTDPHPEVTDAERIDASAIMNAHWLNDDTENPNLLIARIAAALAAARLAGHAQGQEEMRERAATTADGFTCGACGMDGKAGKAIRSLPITGADNG